MLYAKSKNCLIKIGKWSGRIGNNIIQLINAVHVAKLTKSIVQYPKTNPILKLPLRIDFRVNRSIPPSSTITRTWLTKKDIHPFSLPTHAQMREIAREYIKLKIAIDEKYDNNTLIVHIRSGDIFVNPHYKYGQPPLRYYTTVLTQSGCEKVIIVTEQDKRNPTINALLEYINEHLPHIECTVQTSGEGEGVWKDAATILAAKKLCICNSSFSRVWACMSENLKELYCTSKDAGFADAFDDDTKVFVYTFDGYTPFSEWKCTDSQLREMLEFSNSSVKLLSNDNNN